MVFAPRRLSDDLRISPAQLAEVIGERDASKASRSGRSAALADGDFIRDVQLQRNQFAASGLQNLAVGVEDEVVVGVAANCLVAAGRANRELVRRVGGDLDVEVHRKRGGIECWTKICRSRRQRYDKL